MKSSVHRQMIDYIVPQRNAGRQEGNRIAYHTCPMNARPRVVCAWIVVAPHRSPGGARLEMPDALRSQSLSQQIAAKGQPTGSFA